MRTYQGYHRFKGAWRPTAAQARILNELAEGRTNPEIAARVGLSVETVKWHVAQLLAETGSTDRRALARWWREQTGRRTLAPLLVATALAGLVAALVALPAVRAQLQRAACYVPSVGIRSCDAPGLVAPGPVSLSRDGATLTITSLYSADRTTHVRLEITGLPELELTGDPAIDVPRLTADDTNNRVLQATRISLRDADGREYAPLPIAVPMGFGGAIRVGATRAP